MSRPSDDLQKARFLEKLLALGGSSYNKALRESLRWREEEYWRVRDKLIEDGKVRRGRGPGGSVSIIAEAPATEPPVIAPAGPPTGSAPLVSDLHEPSERDLYEPCLKVLREKWAEERGLRDVFVEITASQGGRKTGGAWTRPDISAISMRTFTHWPGRVFDLWTFEIKPRWQFNVTGIFEAAAHARASTHSYVMFDLPENFDETDPDVSRLVSEAQRIGVGVIFFEKADDFDTWDMKVEPTRRQPDPGLLEEFVVTQLSNEARNFLLRWGK